jgi:hypothetical protein
MAEVHVVKTSEFIAVLAADPIPETVNIRRRFAAALVVGSVGALALYVLFVGPRPDIAEAARTVRFNLKFVDAFALALPSLLLLVRLARPDAKPGALALWLFAPLILLALAVVVELMVVPSDEWLPRLIGHNMRYCTTMIPLMAAPILAALIVAMRAGAPQHPGWTGALAGAAAAGIASFLYASHCPDDSPLFVATWYPVATLVCAGAGALAGRLFLAW